MELYERIIETTICFKPQKYYGGREIKNITSFNSRSNLVSGWSEPYLFIASAYVSLGKGFGNSTPLISRKTYKKTTSKLAIIYMHDSIFMVFFM